MKTSFKTILTMAFGLFAFQIANADATEDLWKALKSANDKDALAAIAAGADVNNVDAGGASALSLASCFSGPEVIKAMIDAKGNVNYIQPSVGYSPLCNAATWGNTEAARVLLAAGADAKIIDKLGRDILSIAVASDRLELVKLLVEAGANPALKFKFVGQEQCALMFLIAAYTPADKIKNIAAQKITVEKMGITLPQWLINTKESDLSPLGDIAAYLLSQGADPNHKNGGWGCILNQALAFNKPDIAKALVHAKADLTITMRVKGKVSGFDGTSLMLASLKGYTEVVELMCMAGADVNVKAKEQDTQVSGDANYTYYKTTRKWNTALSLAIDNEHPDTAEVLKKYKAKESK